MEPNQNPPSERDWTPEEMEEFFASQNAVTGLFSGAVANNCVNDFWKDFKSIFPPPPPGPGIYITSIVPPEQGWPIVAHCDLCRKTVIVLSPWAVKPKDGDYFRLNETCLDEEEHIKHNMWPQKWYPWKETK